MQPLPKPWATVPPTGPLLRTADAAEYLGLSVSWYNQLVGDGVLPQPLKVGARAGGVPQPWLDAVIADRARTSGAVE